MSETMEHYTRAEAEELFFTWVDDQGLEPDTVPNTALLTEFVSATRHEGAINDGRLAGLLSAWHRTIQQACSGLYAELLASSDPDQAIKQRREQVNQDPVLTQLNGARSAIRQAHRSLETSMREANQRGRHAALRIPSRFKD